ncbi:Cu,Zn superoxide dismutase-like protein [Clathrospora elynae]|uniref:superoxide dismutase n=1 Tax=Clathrospora elynae TaxID=706981 RepID=A0A6A5SWQ1_9PLEO|nr:Cu,Zn superoxide dismutase-like protein [Clathrospora elynae]
MPSKYLPLLAFGALTYAQDNVQEGAPPPVVLASAKSGVIPALPTATPFTGVPTLQGAIIIPLPPAPGYLPGATGGLEGTATASMNQPSTTYRATMPNVMYNPFVNTVVMGSLEAVGGPEGVMFTVNLTGLPDQAQFGPFNWHIHALPVPSDGNCTATMGHLDPTNRGELYMCDPAQPSTCQVGDLAGKHGGKIMTPGNFSTTFMDPYLSVMEGSKGFFGGLSFVLHSGNTTRLTCANFEMVSAGNGTMNGSASGTMSMPSPTGSNTSMFTGAASKIGGDVVIVVVVVERKYVVVINHLI